MEQKAMILRAKLILMIAQREREAGRSLSRGEGMQGEENRAISTMDRAHIYGRDDG